MRHGKTDWNLKGIYQGQTDIELNETGIKQAEELLSQLKGLKFDVVISSPLKRAYKTAQIISNGSIIADNRLMERSNGKLEGRQKGIDDIDFTDPKETRYDIEQLTMFRKRISDFWDDILEEYRGKNVLVVAHAGVGIYTQCYFKGEPEEGNYKKYKVKNCEVLKLSNS
ncbi:MAG: histidine phosphatase family protein [Proteobacteria bacterium]|nr:histidine phosphatase family protein [Pseudomonadota bacterium]